jgi:hypothetical protein
MHGCARIHAQAPLTNMLVHMHARTDGRTRTHARMHARTRARARSLSLTHTHAQAPMTNIFVSVRKHIYCARSKVTRAHAHTRTHTHTHTHNSHTHTIHTHAHDHTHSGSRSLSAPVRADEILFLQGGQRRFCHEDPALPADTHAGRCRTGDTGRGHSHTRLRLRIPPRKHATTPRHTRSTRGWAQRADAHATWEHNTTAWAASAARKSATLPTLQLPAPPVQTPAARR